MHTNFTCTTTVISQICSSCVHSNCQNFFRQFLQVANHLLTSCAQDLIYNYTGTQKCSESLIWHQVKKIYIQKFIFWQSEIVIRGEGQLLKELKVFVNQSKTLNLDVNLFCIISFLGSEYNSTTRNSPFLKRLFKLTLLQIRDADFILIFNKFLCLRRIWILQPNIRISDFRTVVVINGVGISSNSWVSKTIHFLKSSKPLIYTPHNE